MVDDPVAAFWRAAADGAFDEPMVQELCRRCVGPGSSESVEALFGEIVEPLSDAFEPAAARLYVETFARVIQFSRALPGAEQVDRELREAGLMDVSALAARGLRLLAAQVPAPVKGAQTFVVLSRVTLGADVALVTPLLHALLGRDPRARVVLLAPEATRGIVAGHPRIEFRSVRYARRGDLLERLDAWLPILETAREVRRGCAPGECLVIDPDSRLTQLGLLPLAPDDETRFFPSRVYQAPNRPKLGQLAAHWAQRLVGANEEPAARLWPAPDAIAWAMRLRGLLRQMQLPHPDPLPLQGERGSSPAGFRLTSVHFGVGGNERKRLGEAFEVALLQGLTRAGNTVLLARGISDAELDQTARSTRALRDSGVEVLDLPAGRDLGPLVLAEQRPQVVTWQGESGAFCALVAASDLYLGYDSAGQHVAAAAGVPGVTLFVVSAGERHLERWSPHGAQARVHPVPPDADQQAAAAEALRLAAELRDG